MGGWYGIGVCVYLCWCVGVAGRGSLDAGRWARVAGTDRWTQAAGRWTRDAGRLLEPSQYYDAGFPIVGCCERGIQFATVGPDLNKGGPTSRWANPRDPDFTKCGTRQEVTQRGVYSSLTEFVGRWRGLFVEMSGKVEV